MSPRKSCVPSLMSVRWSQLTRATMRHVRSAARAVVAKSPKGEPVETSSLCGGGWVSPRGRRRVEFIETWRGCLRVCWRRVFVKRPDMSPRKSCVPSLMSVRWSQLTRATMRHVRSAARAVVAKSPKGEPVETSSLCGGGWVSPRGRRRVEFIETWRGCLSHC